MLPNIIHHNQSAYVKDRTISDAVRTIENVMEFSKRYNIEGRMICRFVDFKKAFDTVSRDFLFRTLSAFGFGPSFTRWINTFYNNISSCVLNNASINSSSAHPPPPRANPRVLAFLWWWDEGTGQMPRSRVDCFQSLDR